MMFHDLLATLAIAHWHRYGKPPAGAWQRWLWKPWVRDVLFALDPPRTRLAVERKAP